MRVWTEIWAKFAEGEGTTCTGVGCARYENAREDGVVRNQAVQVAIAINREGRRCILGLDWPTGRAPQAGGSSAGVDAA